MSKKCKFIGFQLRKSGTFPKDELIALIASNSELETKYRRRKQVYYLSNVGNYICGRIITLLPSSSRMLCDIDTFNLSIDVPPDGKLVACLNFFILHKKSMNGLYSYYNGALNFSDFKHRFPSIINRLFKSTKTAFLEKERKAALRSKLQYDSEKAKESYNSKYAVECVPLVRPGKLELFIQQCQSIHAIKYVVASTQIENDRLDSLAPYTVGRIEEFILNQKTKSSLYSALVPQFINNLTKKFSNAIKRTSLIVGDTPGNRRTIDINNLKDWFGDIELSRVLAEAKLGKIDLASSDVISNMIAEADFQSKYFSGAKT